MKRLICLFLFIVGFFILSVQSVSALTYISPVQSSLSAFQSVAEVGPFSIEIPTVIEIPLDEQAAAKTLALIAFGTDKAQPVAITRKTQKTRFSVTSDLNLNNEQNLSDGNNLTAVDYLLDTAKSEKTVTWHFIYSEPITSNLFNIKLDEFVKDPELIKIEAGINNQKHIILAPSDIFGPVLRFPTTTSSDWFVTLTFSQPLRIAEMSFTQLNNIHSAPYLRFLAQPSKSYSLYILPDRPVYLSAGESGTLADSSVNILPIETPLWQNNPLYKLADQDSDGISDTLDNCPFLANPDQKDVNKNGKGDACEDFDLDGVLNAKDNCPDIPNSLQQDKDADGIGDHCDEEESRLTERYFWLPWLGIGAGFVIVISLLTLTLKDHKK